MKLSEYIQHLNKALEANGDLEVTHTVKDYYGIGLGESAHHRINTESGLWEGIYCNKDAGTISLKIDLNKSDDKYPKITFRK